MKLLQGQLIKFELTDTLFGFSEVCGISHEVDGLIFYIIRPIEQIGEYSHFSVPSSPITLIDTLASTGRS